MTRGNDRDLPARAAQELKTAGWSPRRQVDVSEWEKGLAPEGFVMHAPARAFLTEFGGLVVPVSGPGRDYARIGVRLDPMLCLGQKKWFDMGEPSTDGLSGRRQRPGRIQGCADGCPSCSTSDLEHAANEAT